MPDLKKPFGIDLGTTYSAIAHLDATGHPDAIENREGDKTTPSVIIFDPSREIVVGSEAKNEALLNADRVVEMVKRYMGTEGWRRTFDGVDWTPESLSALILGKLARDASDATGVPVEDVVITHPAYFTDVERAATRAAGEIAGLNVLGLIEEPVAAAFAYSMAADKELHGNVLVYDLGGGTFDACVISVSPAGVGRDIRVLVTEGQRTLGGKDWDARTLGYVLSEFALRTDLDLEAFASGALGEEAGVRYREMLQDLTGRVEDAKRALSHPQKPKARVSVSFEDARETIEITREQFDMMTADLLLQTIELTRKAMDEARDKGADTIGTVLLVGGSSRMLQVREAVAELIGPHAEIRLFEPDLAVAKGAAYVAMHKELFKPESDSRAAAGGATVSPEEARERADAFLPGPVAATIVGTSFSIVLSHALGIVAVEGSTETPHVSHIVPSQTPLPFSATERYGLYEDRQTSALIQVKQGDSDVPEDCHALGNVELRLPKPMPRGTAVDVTFTMDAQGMLEVSGLQPDTGAVVSAPVERPATMNADEIAEAARRHTAMIEHVRD